VIRLPDPDVPDTLCVRVLEGPFIGKAGYVDTSLTLPVDAAMRNNPGYREPYEVRVDRFKAFIEKQQQSKAPPAGAPALQASNESDRARLIAKRRAKQSARVKAGMAREAAEAKAEAKALAETKKEYKEMLPYILENQRQMLNRQSALEANAIAAQRNNILDRALNGGGVVLGTPPPPPRVMNYPGQPLANP
jgi:hypothetical protein